MKFHFAIWTKIKLSCIIVTEDSRHHWIRCYCYCYFECSAYLEVSCLFKSQNVATERLSTCAVAVSIVHSPSA